MTETGQERQRQDSPIRLALGGSLAMAAALGIGRFVYTPILPAMIGDLGWSKSDAGLVASANFLGYLIGALAASCPMAPSRQRTALMAALTVSAATTLGMAAVAPTGVFIALRFAGGLASAFVIVLSSTLVLAKLPARRRELFAAIHFAGVGAGIAISAAVVGWMQALGAGWQALWIGTGAIALFATVMVAKLIPSQPGGRPAPTAAAADSSGQRAVPIIAAYGLFGFGYVITATFLVTIVRETPEVRALASSIWVLFGVAAIPSVAFWSWMGTRLSPSMAFVLACVMEAGGVALSVEWLTLPGICLSAILLGGTFMGITALGFTVIKELAGGQPQRQIGFMTVSFALGQMVGPAAAGFLFDSFGSFQIPSLVASAALLLAAGLAAASPRQRPLARAAEV